MKVVFDESGFDEIDHFHPNFDESVPNPFFSLSRHKIRSFLPSLGVFSRILVVFEAPGRSNVRVWSSLVVV